MPSPKAAWPRPCGAATTSAAAVIAPPIHGRTDQGVDRIIVAPIAAPTTIPTAAATKLTSSKPHNRVTRTATQPAVTVGALNRSTHHRTSHPRSATSIAGNGR